MPEILSYCPICNSNKITSFLKCKDYTVSGEIFNVEQCLNCAFKFTNPRPTQTEVGKYYQSQDYISHSNTSKGFINKIYQVVRNITLNKKLLLINSLVDISSDKKILDIGCGTGMFLQTCGKEGWKIKGTEPDEKTRSVAIKNTNAEIKIDFLDITDETFPIITMWHVMEHIHELDKSIETIKTLMDKNSHLIIAVPNPNSYDSLKYKEYWAAYDVPRHLSHFGIENMKALVKKHNLEVVETRGMFFDSFYISMLSTKYRSGSINYIEALLTGLKSNLKAKKDKNYSSIIYIIKKK